MTTADPEVPERRPDGRWTPCPGCGRGVSVRASNGGTTWSTYRHDRGPGQGWCEGTRVEWTDTHPNTEPRPAEAPRWWQVPVEDRPPVPPPAPPRVYRGARPAHYVVDDALDDVLGGGRISPRSGTSGREYEEALRRQWHRDHPAPPPPTLGPELSPELAAARRRAASRQRREEELQTRTTAVPPPSDVLADVRRTLREAARRRPRID